MGEPIRKDYVVASLLPLTAECRGRPRHGSLEDCELCDFAALQARSGDCAGATRQSPMCWRRLVRWRRPSLIEHSMSRCRNLWVVAFVATSNRFLQTCDLTGQKVAAGRRTAMPVRCSRSPNAANTNTSPISPASDMFREIGLRSSLRSTVDESRRRTAASRLSIGRILGMRMRTLEVTATGTKCSGTFSIPTTTSW
jgi:hypothetical protein